jgi:hypothetical protein
MCGSASIPTSRPNDSRIRTIFGPTAGIWGDAFLTLTVQEPWKSLFFQPHCHSR